MFKKIISIYHFLLVFAGAFFYEFPSKKIKVVAVTGTKGKSTVTELITAVLKEAGHKTALSNTLKFEVGEHSRRNLLKMTMPGRFFLQKFLSEAVRAGCDYAVIEMTSEGAKQFRHKFIELDALIVTNVSPEHIESHGSYEKYLKAKLSIAKSLSRSKKDKRVMVVNGDDKEADKFLEFPSDIKSSYSLKDVDRYELKDKQIEFTYKNTDFIVPLPGLFNLYNCLAVLKYAEIQGVSLEIARKAFQKIKGIRGRVEFIDCGQSFDVVVDYAHTVDSLEKFYKVFAGKKKICILGNTGGGRDKWKRPEMGRIANENCESVILTNEDPYDEDPKKIIEEMATAVDKEKLNIIIDRREAINFALLQAEKFSIDSERKTVVLITGKGTDPFIMGPMGTKTPWDDAEVVREELNKEGLCSK